MPDPFDALRLAELRVDSRPAYAAQLLTRIHDELDDSSLDAGLSVSSTESLDYSVLDEALELLAGTGPEYDPFGRGFCLSNHVPMVAESLCALGRPDAVMGWVGRYRPYLSDAVGVRVPISASQWSNELGNLERAGDWVCYFDAELAHAGWVDVLNRWLPRLAPGSYAVHGLLRVAHATRALGMHDTARFRHELAEGLGYWSASYQTLPENFRGPGDLLPSEALALVEQADIEERRHWMFFTQPIASATGRPSFAEVTGLVDLDGDPSAFLSDLAETCAALLVANASQGPTARGIVHCLTAGTATRLMLPYLSDEATICALRYGWQVAAAFYAGLAVEPPAVTATAPRVTTDQLIDDAIACPDDHAIKLTEACLREYRLNPNPVFLAAAHACTQSLFERGLKLA